MKQGKSKRLDIIILLCALLVISGGISRLYSIFPQIHAVGPVEDKDILKDLRSLDESGSVHKIADLIASRPFAQQMRILHTILINKDSALNSDEKAEVGIELLATRTTRAEQNKLLDILMKDLTDLKTPLIYLAADTKQLTVIPMIKNYFASNYEQQNQIFRALSYAITHNNLKNFSQIIQSLGGITSTMATELLWQVIESKKDAQFIAVLITQKADLENARAGKTPLIASVDLNEVEMVQMLLDKGAQVNRFVDPVIGTPLQRALREKRSTIELLLREHGARE